MLSYKKYERNILNQMTIPAQSRRSLHTPTLLIEQWMERSMSSEGSSCKSTFLQLSSSSRTTRPGYGEPEAVLINEYYVVGEGEGMMWTGRY